MVFDSVVVSMLDCKSRALVQIPARAESDCFSSYVGVTSKQLLHNGLSLEKPENTHNVEFDNT